MKNETFVPKGAGNIRNCHDGNYNCRMIKMTATYFDAKGREVKKSVQWFETKPWCETPCFTHIGKNAAKMARGEWTATYEYEETDVKPNCKECIYRYRED